jgi:hypothetical protein
MTRGQILQMNARFGHSGSSPVRAPLSAPGPCPRPSIAHRGTRSGHRRDLPLPAA